MTIRKRLARSNLIMILIPMAIAAALLLLGGGLAVLLLKRVYLPRLGLSMAALHETGERLEAAFDGAKTIAAIYGGTVILALLAASGFTNLYLTKHLFRHIQKPLDILVSGVKRIQEGNLDAPIGYVVPDEFKPACDAVDEMAARLKTSLEAQSRQQQKQELIAGMSHDLKSPLTSIRAYTEGLLDGVAKDEQTQARYLQTIYAKETELETLVNRLFSFAKLDLSEAPAKELRLLSRSIMLTFPDNNPGDWYYIAIQEASNSHEYQRSVYETTGDEMWTKLIDNVDWTKLEK